MSSSASVSPEPELQIPQMVQNSSSTNESPVPLEDVRSNGEDAPSGGNEPVGDVEPLIIVCILDSLHTSLCEVPVDYCVVVHVCSPFTSRVFVFAQCLERRKSIVVETPPVYFLMFCVS